MPNLKPPHYLPVFLPIIIILLCINPSNNQCPFPFQRCICTSSTPFCPCSSITSTQTLNLTSSYFSHLVLVSGYGCRPCPPKCRRCTALEVCTDCFDEYELLNALCEPCPINCKKCRLGVCQECIDEYYIDYQQKCQRCPLPGTKTCTIDSLRSCQSNYWLDNNGAECVNCDPNCRTCSSTTKCTRCIDGYFESNFQCSLCRSQCKTCSNNSTCIDCKLQGYYFNTTISSCIPCPSANCQSCLSNGTCILCSVDNGFYLDKTQRTCLTINSTKRAITRNCRNLTYTLNAADYACELCKDGYYITSDYSNVSQLQCYYGCSILCARCTGAHYGLCDTCVSESEFTLVNRHCVPRLNLNDGTAFQYYYTAFSNSSFFIAPRLILPDSCWHQHVKGGATNVVVKVSRLGVYRMKLIWKIFKYAFDNNNTMSTNQSYTVLINNTKLQKMSNFSSYTITMIAFTCQERTGFSSQCTNGSLRQCIDKNQITFQGIITSDENAITFSSPNSLIAISELLLVGYRCGGIYGDGCIECTDINTCTKCDNPNYYIIAQKCISKCPRSHYTFEEIKKCVEICPVGSYPDDSLHECFSCQSPCQTCNSLTECVTCRQGFFYSSLSSKCQTTCPSRYYADSYRRICEKCTSPCLECVDNIRCISCRQGFLRLYANQTSAPLLGDCVLQCPDGFYTDLITMRCEKCSSPCLTCSMMTDSCTTCVSGYFLMNAKCLSSCPQSYYKDLNTSKCERCVSSCKQCLNLTYCTQCQLGFYLIPNNTCISTCPSAFYPEQILKQCLPCNQNCSTCKSKTVCSTCISGFSYLEEDFTCIWKCPQFYYSLIQSPSNLSVCSRCQLPCYDCSSESYCLSCYDAFLFNGSCMVTCPTGYFADLATLTCLKCDLTQCVQCKNIPTQCTKCNNSLLLVNDKCLISCPYGFYFSQYKAECVLCTGLCSSCSNSTFCLSCIKGFVLENATGLCLNTCQPGFYQVTNTTAGTFQCFPCDKNCQICSYNTTSNKSQCISCKSGYSLTQESVCVSVCPNGFYSLFNKCEKCSPPCLTCLDQQYCLSCINGYGYVYEGACVSQCPYGYFQSSGTCLKCDSTCLTCEGSATQCTACQNNLFLLVQFTTNFTDISTAQYVSFCVSKCPAGYVQVDPTQSTNYQQQCSKCSPNCKTCGIDYEQCTSCSTGMILHQNRCVYQCPISHYTSTNSLNCISCGPTCQYCINSTFCLQCKQPYSLTSDSSCVSQCAPGYYTINNVCRKCMYPCGNCSDADTCESCLTGIFYDGECIDECPEGTYYLKKDGLAYCIRCAQNCSRCVSATQCLFCSVGYLYRSTCLAQCPDGFFPNYGACMQCQQNCAKCDNSYSCALCVNGSLLFENKCIKYCHIGYYEYSVANTLLNTTQSRCLPCNLQCSKCYNSSNQCMQCNKGYFLYIDKCVSQCPQGTYEQSKFSICQPCISPCETCSNAYSCETCIYGYLLYRQALRNQCVQGPTCPNNYYLNVQESICEFQCPSRYYISNSTKTCSTKCASNLVTYQTNRSCLQACPQAMWIDQHLNCQPLQSAPMNLPYLKCKPLQVRNLLFLQCRVNLYIKNINELTVNDFKVTKGYVYRLSIKSRNLFYLLVLGVEEIIRAEYLVVELVNKYKMFSEGDNYTINSSSGTVAQSVNYSKAYISQTQNPTQNRLLQQQSLSLSYPVQNFIIPVYVEQYIPFTIQQRQVGMNFYQIGQAISFAALALWFFGLIKNLKSTSLLFINNLQWLYGLSFLAMNDSLPPNINQFLESFKFSGLVGMFGPVFKFNEQQMDGLWQLQEVQKDKFWAVLNFYDVANTLAGVYYIGGFFAAVYMLLYAVKRLFEWISCKALDREKIQEEEGTRVEANRPQEQEDSIKELVKSLTKSQQIKSDSNKGKSLKRKSSNEISSVNSENSSKNSNKNLTKTKAKANNKQQQQKKSEQSSKEQKPKKSSETYIKISKKSEILLQRYHFNYLYQLLLLTCPAICLTTNIHLTHPSFTGLIQVCIFTVFYIIFLTISFYTYHQSLHNPDYKSRKPLRSTAFFFIYFVQTIAQSAVIIWTSFYFFVGVGFVCIVVNIVAWNWVYRKSEPQKCSYLQVIEVAKGFVLVMLVVGSMKRQKWSRDEIFMFGYGQMATVFVLILLSSVGVAQQLFSQETIGKNSIKNNSSAKYQVLKRLTEKKHDQVNGNQQNQEQNRQETSGFQDDPQFQQEESFFSNKTPVESDSDSSQGDLIDFDESVQSRKQGFGRNQSRIKGQQNPPKNLFRYGKDNNNGEGF